MRPRRTTLVLTLLLAGLILTCGTLLAGTVSGTVNYSGRVPRLPALNKQMNDADPACLAKHSSPVPSETLVLGDGNTLADVLVYVKNAPNGSHSPPSEPVVIDQNGCIYIPHVVGVMVGQTLQFKNSDGLLHNIHGLPKVNSPFNKAMPKAVTSADYTLNKPEPLFKVKCDVHPWMSTYVAVMTHPYFAVTGKDGSFTIDGLPDGTYEVVAHHHFDRFKQVTMKVTVSGGKGTVDFTIQGPPQ